MHGKLPILAPMLAAIFFWSCTAHNKTALEAKAASQPALSANAGAAHNPTIGQAQEADKWLQKALSSYRQGRYPQARKFLEITLSLDPSNSRAALLMSPDLGRRPLPFALHKIDPQDKLAAICKKYYGTTAVCEFLCYFNHIKQSERLQSGGVIILPPFSNARWPQEPLQALPRVVEQYKHILRNGESLSKLAHSYYGNYNLFHLIASYNGLKDASRLADGTTIIIPRFKGLRFARKHGKGASKEHNLAQRQSLALKHYRNKRWKAAIGIFKSLLAANPQDRLALSHLPKAYYRQALLDFQKKNYIQAGQGFKAALSYNPNCRKCESYIAASSEAYKQDHYQQGIVYFKKGMIAEAIAQWEKVYALDPDYKAVNYNLNHARRRLGGRSASRIKNTK